MYVCMWGMGVRVRVWEDVIVCVCVPLRVCACTPYEPFSNNSPVYRPSQNALPLTVGERMAVRCVGKHSPSMVGTPSFLSRIFFPVESAFLHRHNKGAP